MSDLANNEICILTGLNENTVLCIVFEEANFRNSPPFLNISLLVTGF